MEKNRIFEILGIGETKEEREIKKAYREKLVTVNPEDNPEGFQRLREAYEEALILIRKPEKDVQEEDSPVTAYLKEVEKVYSSLSRRLDVKEWERLTKSSLLDDLELEEEIKWKLFRYLADHFRIPAPVWQVLDRAFAVVGNAGEFKEHLPVEFVDFMVWKCAEGVESSDFPFHKLKGEDGADYDEFIKNYNQLVEMAREEAKEAEERIKEIGRKIAFMDSFGIAHPWYEMEKARYALLCGRKEDAEHMVRELWAMGEKDIRMLFSGTYILKACGADGEAAEVYQSLLEHEGMSQDDVYTASLALAEIYVGQQEWEKAKEHALCARRLYNTKKAVDLLQRCNEEVIALYTGEKAAKMNAEDGIMLAWCYIQSGKSKEGLGFFKKYPVLEEDTAECHRAKAVLFMTSGLDEETEAEAKLWRGKLLEKEEEDPYLFAQTFELEGKALQMRFGKLEDKEGAEAERIKKAALAAFDEALSKRPKEIDFLMAKLHFLRDIKEYEQIVELCGKIKEIDAGYYWAYFYAQEAFEKMGKAQEVVDTFYEAKNIYEGMPEIYERAARAFWAYGQYQEARNIIKQAEDAGVDSYYLRVRKLELMRRNAESAEELKTADEYAKQLIDEMEEAGDVEDSLLSDVYLQRAFIHDSSNAESFRQVDGMETWAKRSVELADSNRNRYFLGRFYSEYREEPKLAYENLKICEERGLDFEWMYFYIAQCHEDFEEWNDAIAYYKKAWEKNPQERDFAWRIGWLYRKKVDRVGQREYYEEAMKYLKLHVEKFGENPRELWQISDLHGDNQEYGLALEEIERAMKKDKQSRNWGHKGMLLEMLGRREEAIECFEEAIKVNLKRGMDYSYSYYRMHDYFCESRQYERGLAWFQEKAEQVKSEEQRRKIMGYIRYYYIALQDWPKALETTGQIYGGTTLEDYVCDGWKMEGKRIDDLLDLFQYYVSGEELRQKAQEAEALLDGAGAAGLEEDYEGRRCAYMQIAYCYADYLWENEKGLLFFKKALEQAKKGKEGIDDYEYRSTLVPIMRVLHRMGDLEQAKEYKELFFQSLAGYYKECEGLGKRPEELYLGDFTRERVSLYQLFRIHYYCGEYEEARKYLQRMETCPWCSTCTCEECTEEWEIKGYMALYEGRREEAAKCFAHAIACGSRGNFDAKRELKLMEMQ